MSVDGELLVETRNHVALITLNRPAALNALSLGMIRSLDAELRRCAADAGVRAVLLRGAGDRAFCAGGDIRALHESRRQSGTMHRDFFEAEYALDDLLHFYPKPYAALLDGITLGGGMGLAQGSTLRIVGERTRIAMPEVGIGLFPDVGATFFLSRLPGALGAYLGLTGVQIRGVDAIYAGLADVFLPAAASAALTDDLAQLDWRGTPHEALRAFIHARALRELPAPGLGAVRAAVDAHFCLPTVGAILGSLDAETRGEYADWARQTAALLRSRSPTMLCVTLTQLQRGKSLDFAAALRMELGMMAECFEQGDFIEGVRAVLIDKDNAPRWNPASLAEVTDSAVAAFFRERWPARTHPLADLEARRPGAGAEISAAARSRR